MRFLITLLLLLCGICSTSQAQTAFYRGRAYTPESYPRGANYTYPNCSMCNAIRSQWRSQGWVSGSGRNKVMRTTTKPKPAPKPAELKVEKKPEIEEKDGKKYETRYREETKTITETAYRTVSVWKCVNGRCGWYNEYQPYQQKKTVTVKVPYKVLIEDKPEPEPEPEKPKLDPPPKPEPEPTIKPVDDSTPLLPTPLKVVEQIIKTIQPGKGDLLVDAGCGDGRFLIEAGLYGCRAIGVEIDESTVKIARARIAGAKSDAVVIQGDALDFDYSAADIVVIYQFPDLTEEIVKKIPNGVKVVSYMHDVPGVETKKHTVVVDGEPNDFFVGVVGQSRQEPIERNELTFGL